MASPALIGTTGSLLEQPGSPKKTTSAIGSIMRRTFVFCGTGVPVVDAIGTLYDDLALTQIEDTRNTRDGKRTIIYDYEEPDASRVTVDYDKLVKTETEFDTNLTELDIRQHPDYEEAWAETKPGVDSYLAPQPVYRYTDYRTAHDTTLNDVASLGVPPGWSGSSSDWLMTGKVSRKIGIARSPTTSALVAIYQRVRIYQRAMNGWDTDIY